MGRNSNKSNDNLPSVSPFTSLKRILILVGRPLYYSILVTTAVSTIILHVLGRTIELLLKWFLQSLLEILFSITALLAIRLGRLARRKKTKPLPVKLPGLRKAVALITLRLALTRLKLIRRILHPFEKIRLPKISFTIKKLFLAAFASTFLILTVGFWIYVLNDLPSPEQLITRDQEVSTKIYDVNGVLLYKIFKDENRSIIKLSKVPMHVRQATLAAEDAEFYDHPGFSIKGITRAIQRNLASDELEGGSTITQQLVKNALLSSEKTVIRKLREIVLSIQVELAFTKDEILQMYLNEVSYGGTAYGIQEASNLYFDKDVSELNLSEAALLAGLPKSPTKFSPFGPSPQLGLAREQDVLNLMAINRYITHDEADLASQQTISIAPNKTEILAPHFVFYVRQILEQQYGREVVEKGGLEVITTLDYSIQQLAEQVVKDEIARLGDLRVGNGAAIVVDPTTGAILAMVGSKDYFDIAADGNVNVTTAVRNPGSSIKVINYAYALGNGFTAATPLDDSPVTFNVVGQPPYSPVNYDNKFRGILSLRSSFAESRNVTAVKLLANYGVSHMVELGRQMGITTWNNPSNYGLSLTLGGGGVKLIDLAQVYSTVANYGNRVDFSPLTKVTTYKGTVLEENGCSGSTNTSRFKLADVFVKIVWGAEIDNPPCEGTQIIDPRAAFILTNILSDNIARSPAFGLRSMLNISGHPEVAVKTGTSNDLRDNWTVGYNKDILVAVWVGNNDNSPMSRVASGVTGASPIFNSIMRAILASSPSIPWQPPEGLVNALVCQSTGTLPCEGCGGRSEWFLAETVPTKHCNPSNLKKNTKKSRRLAPSLLEEAASVSR